MPKVYIAHCLAGLIALSIAGCSPSGDGKATADEAGYATLNDKYGHMSAIYLCGEDELQTSYTKDQTMIAYKGEKFDASRTVQVSDNAFSGETYNAVYNGDLIEFKGRGSDVTLTINDDVIACEKISCIPLGEIH